jgi:hypothetical protein
MTAAGVPDAGPFLVGTTTPPERNMIARRRWFRYWALKSPAPFVGNRHAKVHRQNEKTATCVGKPVATLAFRLSEICRALFR